VNELLAFSLIVQEFWHCRIVLQLFADHEDARIILGESRLPHLVEILLQSGKAARRCNYFSNFVLSMDLLHSILERGGRVLNYNEVSEDFVKD
jgi:hypothetical protein